MDGLKAGRIVYCVISESMLQEIVSQRKVGGYWGNELKAGDVVPAMVVKVWSASSGGANLKLMLDGPDTFWATSIVHDAEKKAHTWHWMFDGQATRHEPRIEEARSN